MYLCTKLIHKQMLLAKCINLDEPVYMCTNTYKVTELELNKEYEVESVEMYRSYTNIKLKNIDRKFNSVIFEFYENGNEIDIYNDPRYNPYI